MTKRIPVPRDDSEDVRWSTVAERVRRTVAA